MLRYIYIYILKMNIEKEYIADRTPSSIWKACDGCCTWEFTEVYHHVSWKINYSGGNKIYVLRLLTYMQEYFLLIDYGQSSILSGKQVISLELSTGIPLLYIYKEGKFKKRGSPVGDTEAGVYAYTRV